MGTGHLDITCIVSRHYTVPRAPKCWENGVSWWQSLELPEQCQLATVVLEVVLPATSAVLEVVITAVLLALGIRDPRAIGPQDLPALHILDLRAIGPRDLPALGILDPRAIGPRDLPAIGPLDLPATIVVLLAIIAVLEVVIIAVLPAISVALVSVDLAALIVDKAVARMNKIMPRTLEKENCFNCLNILLNM